MLDLIGRGGRGVGYVGGALRREGEVQVQVCALRQVVEEELVGLVVV